MSAFTIHNLRETEDSAPKFGFGEQQEARFAMKDLGAERTGVCLLRVKPGRRQPFGHRHQQAEEVYVVIGGSGRIKLDDEVREVGVLDAIRVAPEVKRAFEGGPEGLEVVVIGQHHEKDAEPDFDFWPED